MFLSACNTFVFPHNVFYPFTNSIICVTFYPFPEQQILDSSKLKEYADDNFNLKNENGGRFSKRVENTMEKGEIAWYEQFLLFPQCFQKACTADTYKQGLVLERANCHLQML